MEPTPDAEAAVERHLSRAWIFRVGDAAEQMATVKTCPDGGFLEPGPEAFRGSDGRLYRLMLGTRAEICKPYKESPQAPKVCTDRKAAGGVSYGLWVESRQGKDCFFDSYDLEVHGVVELDSAPSSVKVFLMPGGQQIQVFVMGRASVHRLVSGRESFLRFGPLEEVQFVKQDGTVAVVTPKEATIAMSEEGVFAMMWIEDLDRCVPDGFTVHGASSSNLAFSSDGAKWVVHPQKVRIIDLKTGEECGGEYEYALRRVRYCTTYFSCVSTRRIWFTSSDRMALRADQVLYGAETNRTGSWRSTEVSAVSE